MEDPDKDEITAELIMDTLEVAQKPTKAKMRELEMIFKVGISDDDENLKEDHWQIGKEYVYTDSGSYWINPGLMRKLYNFFVNCQNLSKYETSMYSDFMVCQGISSRKDSVTRIMANKEDSALSNMRKDICKLMSDVPLVVLALKKSKYYHLGTMREYMEAYCLDQGLKVGLDFGQIIGKSKLPHHLDIKTSRSIIISSEICQSLPDICIIEYCKILNPKLVLENNTILSHCIIGSDLPLEQLPGDHIYLTVPIRESEFVTIAFHVDDNLKKPLDWGTEEKPAVPKSPILKILEDEEPNRPVMPDLPTLWTSKLFCAFSSAEKAFEDTAQMIKSQRAAIFDANQQRFSINDLMLLKNEKRMLAYRAKFSK